MSANLSTEDGAERKWPSIGLRSALYVPGSRPDRFDRAVASGADVVLLDLEDSVADDDKSDARRNVAEWLSSTSAANAWVRVNHRNDLVDDDLAMVSEAFEAARVCGVVMPKATAETVSTVGVPTIALIETAVGLTQALDIALSPSVVRLGLGEADLIADLGIEPSHDERELAPVRSSVVVASAAAGLVAPQGPASTNLDDLGVLADSCERLRRLGFGGRSLIHPKQLATIHESFAPTAAQVARARRIVEAADAAAARGEAVAVVDGEFVDEPVIRRARSVLSARD